MVHSCRVGVSFRDPTEPRQSVLRHRANRQGAGILMHARRCVAAAHGGQLPRRSGTDRSHRFDRPLRSLYVLEMAAANASARGQRVAILTSPLHELTGFYLAVDCRSADCRGERNSRLPNWPRSTRQQRSETCCACAACAAQAPVAGGCWLPGWRRGQSSTQGSGRGGCHCSGRRRGSSGRWVTNGIEPAQARSGAPMRSIPRCGTVQDPSWRSCSSDPSR